MTVYATLPRTYYNSKSQVKVSTETFFKCQMTVMNSQRGTSSSGLTSLGFLSNRATFCINIIINISRPTDMVNTMVKTRPSANNRQHHFQMTVIIQATTSIVLTSYNSCKVAKPTKIITLRPEATFHHRILTDELK